MRHTEKQEGLRILEREEVLRRTWAEIDLDALEWNYRRARERIGPAVRYLGVVKADAYGHGAVQVSRKLEALGCDYLAVSSLDEARELRRGGISGPILILGHTPPEMTGELLHYGITQTVSALAKAEAFSAAAKQAGGTLKVHIKVDTGMSRLGFLVRRLRAPARCPLWKRKGFSPTSPSRTAPTRPTRRTRAGSSGSSRRSWKRWRSADGGLPSGTAPTAGRWNITRKCIWIWCGPVSPSTARERARRLWECVR